VNKKQGGVSRHDEIGMGLVFWSGAVTAAMPSGVLTFCLLFGQTKSKKKNKELILFLVKKPETNSN
jgi:hypothetical protein